jgi:AAA15 family ATPase/GTPase
MIEKISIKNFKSIADDTIELGRINVFIGENGCGKSNILEAIAFASTAEASSVINKTILSSKGVRIAKPSLMVNSFKDKEQTSDIFIDTQFNGCSFPIKTTADNGDIHTAKWIQNIVFERSLVKPSYMEAANFQQHLSPFVIYTLNTPALRGMTHESKEDPVGINGEKLDMLIANFSANEIEIFTKIQLYD